MQNIYSTPNDFQYRSRLSRHFANYCYFAGFSIVQSSQLSPERARSKSDNRGLNIEIKLVLPGFKSINVHFNMYATESKTKYIFHEV